MSKTSFKASQNKMQTSARLLLIIFSTCFLILTCANFANAQQSTCFARQQVRNLSVPGAVYERWIVSPTEQQQLRLQNLERYHNTVTQNIADSSVRALLLRQREIYRTAFGNSATEAYDDVLAARVGELSESMSCLESQLFEHFLSHVSSTTNPVPYREFMAYILVPPPNVPTRQFIIYFIINSSDASVTILPRHVVESLQNDLRQDWVLEQHIHNHPFAFDNPYEDIAGTTIPSQGDVRSYIDTNRNYGLSWAVVINGIGSIHVPQSQFALMSHWPSLLR